MRTSVLLVLVVFGLVPNCLFAQSVPRSVWPGAGERLRVSLEPRPGEPARVIGTLSYLGGTTAMLEGRSGPIVVDLERVRRLEIATDRDYAAGAGRGLALGLGIGVVVGGLWGAVALPQRDGCEDVCTTGQGAFIGSLLGVFLGAPVGVLFGVTRGVRRWEVLR